MSLRSFETLVVSNFGENIFRLINDQHLEMHLDIGVVYTLPFEEMMFNYLLECLSVIKQLNVN